MLQSQLGIVLMRKLIVFGGVGTAVAIAGILGRGGTARRHRPAPLRSVSKFRLPLRWSSRRAPRPRVHSTKLRLLK